MANDCKYIRLYPERAVEQLRRRAENALETFESGGNLAAALLWREALEALDELGFPPDEPLFLLRGQDMLAPEVVRFYIGRAADRLAPIAKNHDELMDHADRMAAWQPRKLPD